MSPEQAARDPASVGDYRPGYQRGNGPVEPGRMDRLEQVVERSGLEGADQDCLASPAGATEAASAGKSTHSRMARWPASPRRTWASLMIRV